MEGNIIIKYQIIVMPSFWWTIEIIVIELLGEISSIHLRLFMDD